MEALQRAGLWRRECWYAESVPRESDLPVDPSRLSWTAVPDGWSRVPEPKGGRSVKRRIAEVQSSFVRELVASAWNSQATKGLLERQYWSDLSLSGHEHLYASWRRERKSPKRLFKIVLGKQYRVSSRAACPWLEGVPYYRFRTGVGGRRPRMVWAPRREGDKGLEEAPWGEGPGAVLVKWNISDFYDALTASAST
jgi:hypothetical protein